MREKIKLLKEKIQPKMILAALTLLCFASLTASYFSKDMALSVREAVGALIVPMQTGINQIGRFGAGLTQERKNLEDALNEIEQLKEELKACNEQLDLYREDSIENEQLKKLLQLKEEYKDYDMVGATIVSRNSNNWYNQFTINKGTNDGLAIDMNVITQDGLVGIITSISENFSIVTSIIDDSMRVSGQSSDKEDTCVIEGSLDEYNSGRIKLSYMRADDEIQPQSVIVTSNVSNKYLPGLVIGYVSEVKVDENRLTKTGYIVPKVDFYHLNQVLVITTLKVTYDKK